MKNMFYVSIDYQHSFAFESKPSKMTSDVVRNIITEIKYRIEKAFFLFDWAGSVFSIFFLYVFFKCVFPSYYAFQHIWMCLILCWHNIRAWQYRRKYLTTDSFDNKYLTQELYELDERKLILERPTIMPLTRFEKNRYIEVGCTTCIFETLIAAKIRH